ncbi:hypothetical protein FJ872_10320 [Mesorhizobium sp. B2-5-9]|nr:hypothetical protein FJ872_10320 [Mesorhizobium sp. B2-5-9]
MHCDPRLISTAGDLQLCRRIRSDDAGKSQTFEISRDNHPFVILGRSKERSDAAQTLASMP